MSYDTINFKSKIINKMGEQFKIIEYPLIILFIITGAVFLFQQDSSVYFFKYRVTKVIGYIY